MKNVKVQEEAPKFEGKAIVDGQIKNISLADFAGKYLVLFFYPLDLWVCLLMSAENFTKTITNYNFNCICFSTFVCPTELVSFSDHIEEFKKIDANVVGCSCDSHFSHLAFINTPRKVNI